MRWLVYLISDMALRPYKHVNVFVKLLVVLIYMDGENQNSNRALQNSSVYIARLLYKDIQIQHRRGNCCEISPGLLRFQFQLVRTAESTFEDKMLLNDAYR